MTEATTSPNAGRGDLPPPSGALGKAPPTAAPRAKSRRWPRAALLFALLAVAVLLWAYVGRWRLFGGLLRGIIAQQVEKNLGATVTIGTLKGSLLGGVELGDIRLVPTGRGALLCPGGIGRLKVGYSLFELFTGGLKGLKLVEVEAPRLALDARRFPRSPEPPAPPEWEKIFGALAARTTVTRGEVDLTINGETSLSLRELDLYGEPGTGEARYVIEVYAENFRAETPFPAASRVFLSPRLVVRVGKDRAVAVSFSSRSAALPGGEVNVRFPKRGLAGLRAEAEVAVFGSRVVASAALAEANGGARLGGGRLKVSGLDAARWIKELGLDHAVAASGLLDLTLSAEPPPGSGDFLRAVGELELNWREGSLWFPALKEEPPYRFRRLELTGGFRRGVLELHELHLRREDFSAHLAGSIDLTAQRRGRPLHDGPNVNLRVALSAADLGRLRWLERVEPAGVPVRGPLEATLKVTGRLPEVEIEGVLHGKGVEAYGQRCGSFRGRARLQVPALELEILEAKLTAAGSSLEATGDFSLREFARQPGGVWRAEVQGNLSELRELAAALSGETLPFSGAGRARLVGAATEEGMRLTAAARLENGTALGRDYRRLDLRGRFDGRSGELLRAEWDSPVFPGPVEVWGTIYTGERIEVPFFRLGTRTGELWGRLSLTPASGACQAELKGRLEEVYDWVRRQAPGLKVGGGPVAIEAVVHAGPGGFCARGHGEGRALVFEEVSARRVAWRFETDGQSLTLKDFSAELPELGLAVSGEGHAVWAGEALRGELRLSELRYRGRPWRVHGPLAISLEAGCLRLAVERVEKSGGEIGGWLELNVPARAVRGELWLAHLPTDLLESLLPEARLPEGRLSGRVMFDGPLRSPHLRLSARAEGLRLGSAVVDTTLSGRLTRYRAELDQATLDGLGGSVELAGSLPLGALPLPDSSKLPLIKRELALQLRARHLTAEAWRALFAELAWPSQLTAAGDLELSLRGTLSAPAGQGKLILHEARYRALGAREGRVGLILAPGGLSAELLEPWETGAGALQVSLWLPWRFGLGAPVTLAAEGMRGRVRLHGMRQEALLKLTPPAESRPGEGGSWREMLASLVARADLEVSGDPQRPRLSLRAGSTGGALLLPPPLPPVEKIALLAQYDPGRGRLDLLHGQAELGEEKLQLEGYLEFRDLTLAPESLAAVELRASGRRVLVASDNEKRARADINLRLSGRRAAPSGKKPPAGEKWAKLEGTIGLPLVLFRPAVSAAGPAEKKTFHRTRGTRLELPGDPAFGFLQLNVNLKAEEIKVDSALAQARLSANLHLGGDGAQPLLSGTVSGTTGQVLLPGLRLAMHSLSVEMPPDQSAPTRVNAEFETRTATTQIFVRVTGPMDDPRLSLRSDPPYPQDDLLALLALGGTREAVNKSGGTLLAATQAGRFMLQQLDTAAGAGTFFSRLSFEVEQPGGQHNEPIIRAVYELSRAVFLIGERDQRGDSNGDVQLRFRFK